MGNLTNNLPLMQWHPLQIRRRTSALDPAEEAFARLRLRLVLWYTTLLAGISLLLSFAVATETPLLVSFTTRADLDQRVGALARQWQDAPGRQPCGLNTPPAGYLLACYDRQGRLLGSSGADQGRQGWFWQDGLARLALTSNGAASEAYDVTGKLKVTFQLGLFADPTTPWLFRSAEVVSGTAGSDIVGIVQVGALPSVVMAHRSQVVWTLLLGTGCLILLGAPLGGSFFARRAIYPARLAYQRQHDFIANASHELRTPLALLSADAELLLRERAQLSADAQELVEDIAAEARHMSALAQSMLTLASLDAGSLHLEHEVLDLNGLTQGVVRRVRALVEQRALRIELVEKEGAPIRVLGDRLLLEQALLALLDNAIKYTEPGGQIQLIITVEKGQASLEIRDTGIGIAVEHLPHLGERFYRIDKARAREAGGSGLGLSIVRGLAVAHGGMFTVRSSLGQGTTATLVLPILPERAQ